jgi:hypothetical protein
MPEPPASRLFLLIQIPFVVGAKEVVEEGRLAGGLRTKYGDQVVVEACWDNMLDVEVFGDLGAVAPTG